MEVARSGRPAQGRPLLLFARAFLLRRAGGRTRDLPLASKRSYRENVPLV
jgi:hypothetical protein